MTNFSRFLLLAAIGSFALAGCGTDTGVDGIGGIDGTSEGSDAVINTDADPCANGQCDGQNGDTTTYGDGWNPGDAIVDYEVWVGDSWINPGDSWDWPDGEPIGCVSDSQCGPSSPCSKSYCDLGSHQCISYVAQDGTPCGANGGLCGGGGSCYGGQCLSTGPAPYCNDNNPCTSDYCDPAIGCVFSPIPGCGSTGCKQDQDCNDFNSCSTDLCVFNPGGGGQCTHYGNLGQPGCCDPNSQMQNCSDGSPCTYDYCGANYQCVFEPVPGCGNPGCTADYQCDDGIKCSIDKCQMDAIGQGKCTHVGDLSQKGFCCDPFMDAMTCYDGNDCTYDNCGMDYQCQYQQIPGCGTTGCKSNSDCNDGNACTQDMCFGGQCSYGGMACASPDPCMNAYCDPKSGQCVYTPIPGCGNNGCAGDFMCDDGNYCTVDKCAVSSSGTGKCTHSADLNQPYCCDPTSSKPTNCNDGDSCTTDFCDMNYTCESAIIPGCVFKCKADSDCTGGDVCTIAKCDVGSGVCLYGSIPNCCNPSWCDDGNPCTKDSCAPDGSCAWSTIPGCVKPCDPVMCNDYNPCTADSCDIYGNCQNVPTPNCVQQFCKSDPECKDSDPCTYDMCDFTTYTCQHYQQPGCGQLGCKSNADCNDFDSCTGDLCLNNMCAHKAITCDDGNPCTADQCLAMTGGCSNAPIAGCTATPCKSDMQCDDKNPCSVDTCSGGFCNHMYMPNCFPPP
jgi:hypothetical protein